MKVCLLNESFPPVLDGVANVLLNYAKYLPSDFNSPVIVGTPRYPDADYSAYPYEVVAYPSFNTASFANGYRTGYPLQEKAVSKLAEFEPDIIHSHCPASANVIARLLRERTQAPIAFTYHTKYDIDLRRIFKIRQVADETIKAMVSNIEACDDVWTVSRGAGESLKALGFKGDYHVMNNGVDFERGRVDAENVRKVTEGYDLPDGVPVFLFVGRIITYKGIPMILDALKILSDAGHDFRMVFIGKGPDMELMQKKAEDLGISGNRPGMGKCIFTGPIYDRDALRAWNTRADLFLFPSTFDTNGLVVREAAACGLASVLVKDSCAAEGVTDNRNGFLIEETTESMGDLLIRLSGELGHVHDVGTHAMDEIYMSWRDAVAEAYERYAWLLEEKAHGRLREPETRATDYLVKLAARSMDEAARARRVRTEFFNDFKDTAIGMMDNIQEAGEGLSDMLERVSTGTGEKVQQVVSGTGEKVQQAVSGTGEKVHQAVTETGEKVQQAVTEAEQKVKSNLTFMSQEVLLSYENMAHDSE